VTSLWPLFIRKNNQLEIIADNIWPKSGETNDRIELQLKLGYILQEYLRSYNSTKRFKKKIILVSDARYVFEPFVSGSKVFEENCPASNCFITTDRKRYKKTADALLMALPQEILQFMPKPRKQVTNELTNVYINIRNINIILHTIIIDITQQKQSFSVDASTKLLNIWTSR